MLWDQLRFTGLQRPTINWNFINSRIFSGIGSRDYTSNILPVANQAVFDNISDGVLILDQENRVISSNPAARKIIQSVSSGPSLSTEILDNQHVSVILSMWPSLKAYLNSTTRKYVTSVQSNNREVLRSFEIHVTPIIDKEDLFYGRILLMQETTERENAIKALKQRKQQLRLMVERLQKVDKKRTYTYNDLDTELRYSLTRVDLHLNNLRKGIDEGFNDAINRLEQEISNLYKRFEQILDQGKYRDHSDSRTFSVAATPSLSSTPSETHA